jgi:hypothetical protein
MAQEIMNRTALGGRPPRRMPVGPPRAVLLPPRSDADSTWRLHCGHCRAKLKGIYDWSDRGDGRYQDGSMYLPQPNAELWRRVVGLWEDTVWCVAPSIRKRAQRTGHLVPRRGIDEDRQISDMQAGLREPRDIPLDLPAWVQCWRCQYVNLVTAAPKPPNLITGS